ncbi:MAG: hypothetical protein QMD46_05260 [Methanomicrobiales archaeon]|nr:hypothetical protein [Methanomicrobiales archaeon]
MDDKELTDLLKRIKTKDLKDAARQRNIPLGRCPTKVDIARKLPDDVLKELAKE